MWKRALLPAILMAIIIGIGVSPLSAQDGDDSDIDVKYTPVKVLPPENLTLTYVSDYQVDINWTKPVNAAKTMVRAAVGRYPENMNHGYLIYYGEGTFASDTGVSLDETGAAVYYRAWSETEENEWSPYFSQAFIEGVGMTLIALGLGNLVQLLLIAGVVGLALVVKNTNANGDSNRDPVLVIMAGIAIILYSWGMIEPDIAANTGLQATPISIVGLYLVVKAGLYAFGKHEERGG